MTQQAEQIIIRLSLVTCDAHATRILTTLDASNRIRKLPDLIWNTHEDETPEQAILRTYGTQRVASLPYLEQLGTVLENGQLKLDVLGLVSDQTLFRPPGSDWWPIFDLFPWEDWRKSPPDAISRTLLPQLYRWAKQHSDESQHHEQTIGTLFADHGQKWACEHLFHRYDYLYQAGLLPEALRDQSGAAVSVRHHHVHVFGQTMLGQDRKQLAKAISKLRQNLTLSPCLAYLVRATFTLGNLQKMIENLTGIGLHTQNFRRDILRSGLIEPLDAPTATSGGRPAQVYNWQNALNPQISHISLPMPRRKI